ncbi:hypothetical protein LCGC14_2202000 [marine sediment metagenome]|uniref:Uncharacterized protein n=1 Tax=marine sediment metagenome TaxID=412755 RepID=A0A0F9FTW0_9ZZZZ
MTACTHYTPVASLLACGTSGCVGWRGSCFNSHCIDDTYWFSIPPTDTNETIHWAGDDPRKYMRKFPEGSWMATPSIELARCHNIRSYLAMPMGVPSSAPNYSH